MDFFGRQDAARNRSRWLLGAFALATGSVAVAVGAVLAWSASVAFATEGHGSAGLDAGLFMTAAVATAGFIGCASLWRLRSLRTGGGYVALSLGGERVTGLERDPVKKMLHNVVEEMAIAAGLPVPEVYVLENESGINAFAAGIEPASAAIAVTRGALDRLSRAELQGVVAHEFSHILNGDMRLNARAMGYIFGLLAVSMVGRTLARGGAYATGRRRVGNRRNGGNAALVGIGLAIFLLGSVGVFAGRLLQAAVSRQREELADASAVQFTRDPTGLANALKRIASSPLSSVVHAVRREEIGHMLFATGRRRLNGLMATHPPIARRIKALDPHWHPGEPLPPRPAPTKQTARAAASEQNKGPTSSTRGTLAIASGSVAALVGTVNLSIARRVLALLPQELHEMVLEPEGAASVCLGLLLDPRERQQKTQLGLIEARLGTLAAGRIAGVAKHIAELSITLRLALLDLSCPALHHLSEARQADLLYLAQRLIEIDGVISPHEVTLVAAIEARLQPGHRSEPDTKGALAVLALLASAGHADNATASAAWHSGLEKLGGAGFSLPDPLPDFLVVRATATGDVASQAAQLAAMGAPLRKTLLEAMTIVAEHDSQVCGTELELLRAAAVAMGLPMPPLDTHGN